MVRLEKEGFGTNLRNHQAGYGQVRLGLEEESSMWQSLPTLLKKAKILRGFQGLAKAGDDIGR